MIVKNEDDMKMKTKLNLIFRFATVLMVLCIVPSGAFASETNTKLTPPQNITDENFADVNENVTELNDKITELTALIEEINAAESLEDLKEIMSSSQGMPGMGPEMGPGPMQH